MSPAMEPRRPGHDVAAAAIWQARREGRLLDPDAVLGRLDLDAAFGVQRHLVALRVAAGEQVVGWKLGYTSEVMRRQMGVDRPNFGPLTDAMVLPDGGVVAAHLVQPRVEPEVAVRLARPLAPRPEGVTRADVAASLATAHACLEVVHSTWVDYRFTLEQNTADNSSAGQLVLGPELPLDALDEVEVSLADGTAELGCGRGADAFGHPLDAVAWLATQLSARGDELRAGDIVLTGGLTRAWPLEPGGRLTARFQPVGGEAVEVSVRRAG